MSSIGIVQDVYHQRFPESASENYQQMRNIIIDKLSVLNE